MLNAPFVSHSLQDAVLETCIQDVLALRKLKQRKLHLLSSLSPSTRSTRRLASAVTDQFSTFFLHPFDAFVPRLSSLQGYESRGIVKPTLSRCSSISPYSCTSNMANSISSVLRISILLSLELLSSSSNCSYGRLSLIVCSAVCEPALPAPLELSSVLSLAFFRFHACPNGDVE